MNILINASNLSGGGGGQVADSICRYLDGYLQHQFLVVLPSALDNTAKAISSYKNVNVVRYNYPSKDWYSFITCRNFFLDSLVEKNQIQCVLTVFGPMKWKPRCAHVCGFALSQIVIPESPYFTRMTITERFRARLQAKLWEYLFYRSADCFYTENSFITERLQKKFKKRKIITITNNYNQVYVQPEKWRKIDLPAFDGIQLLCVTSSGKHKNLTIALDVARILKEVHPLFKFRFVFTIKESDFPIVPDSLKDCFCFTGKVDISECPSLYSQCDFEFQPTLLECFTATYPEAMVMRKPIITTDTDFAKSICGDAAVYYNATSPQSAADKIYMLFMDKDLQIELLEKGAKQLNQFDTSQQRVEKVLLLCENAIVTK